MAHPRDRVLTIYGRKPALEVLEASDVPVRKVFLADNARGPSAGRIRTLAEARGVPLEVVAPERVHRISRRPKQDQGVAVDVEGRAMRTVDDVLAEPLPARCQVLAVDGVTTPANLGLIIRSATVLGLDGVLVPRRGTAEIGPLVIKASAGVAFRAPLITCAELPEALLAFATAGFATYGLSDGGSKTLADATLEDRAVLVVGNETEGVTEEARPFLRDWLQIPMAGASDSLNVACAATVVAYELARRRTG